MRLGLGVGVLAVTLLSGCEGFLQPALSDSRDSHVARTYRMTACRPTFGSSTVDAPIPCTSYVAGTSHVETDSARLQLVSDGTAFFLRADRNCTSGISCASVPTTVTRGAGTYRFGRDSLVVTIDNFPGGPVIAFVGPVPERITRRWEGPDSLTFNLSNGSYLGVMRPSP